MPPPRLQNTDNSGKFHWTPGVEGCPLPLSALFHHSAPPCTVPAPAWALQEPWTRALARVPPQGAGSPPPSLSSPQPAPCSGLAVNSRHGSSTAWDRWEAGWNRLQPAPGCPAASSILSRSVPSARALWFSPLKAFAYLVFLSSCDLCRTKAFPLWLHSPPPPQQARIGKIFPLALSWNHLDISMPLAHPRPDLETDGGVLCSAVPKCQPSTTGTSLGGYFPSLRKNVQGRRVGMEASRTLVLKLLLCEMWQLPAISLCGRAMGELTDCFDFRSG